MRLRVVFRNLRKFSGNLRDSVGELALTLSCREAVLHFWLGLDFPFYIVLLVTRSMYIVISGTKCLHLRFPLPQRQTILNGANEPVLSVNMLSSASIASVTCRPCKSIVFSSVDSFLKTQQTKSSLVERLSIDSCKSKTKEINENQLQRR